MIPSTLPVNISYPLKSVSSSTDMLHNTHPLNTHPLISSATPSTAINKPLTDVSSASKIKSHSNERNTGKGAIGMNILDAAVIAGVTKVLVRQYIKQNIEMS